MNPELYKKVEKINELYHKANVDIYHLWLSDMLFKWHWWVDLGFAVLPWVIWILVRKKESSQRLLYSGAVVLIVSSFLDAIGMAMGLWGYNSMLYPLMPPYVPWDFCVIPVSVMLLIQIKPKANPFLKAAILSAIGAFVFQPFLQWIGIYDPKNWRNYYSFPFAFAIYLIGHCISRSKTYKKIE